MKRILYNQDFYWELVKLPAKTFARYVAKANDEEIYGMIECVVNTRINGDLITNLKLHLVSKNKKQIVEILVKHQLDVKTALALILTEILCSERIKKGNGGHL